MRIEERDWVEPIHAFRASEGTPGVVFLDSSIEPGPLARWSVLAALPLETIAMHVGAGLAHTSARRSPVDPFARLEALHRSWFGASDPRESPTREDRKQAPLPFTGGVVAAVGYDCGRALEVLPDLARDDPALPDLWASAYGGALVFDRVERRVFLVSRQPASGRGERALEGILGRARSSAALREDPPGSGSRGTGSSHFPPSGAAARPTDPVVIEEEALARESFVRGVGRIREEIARGEIYQANLTRRVRRSVDPRGARRLYERLRERSPVPFGSFVDAGDFQILSASPERFFLIDNDTVETRPIKGTSPRSQHPAADRALAERLLSSPKDLAELLMIVDLERNDLGRIAVPGSVEVARFPELEKYSTVWHLAGTVRGRLARGTSVCAVLQAGFPGGSITGAPKIRAMEILEELEPARRKFSMGSLAVWDAGGRLDSSILIRTMVLRGAEAVFHVGGGIVADSEPEAEYLETIAKAAPLMSALGEEP